MSKVMAAGNTKIAVNTRILTGHLTGVQRYLISILENLPERICQVGPAIPMHGIRGHAWEQFVLPARAKHKLLWSPSNTGPLGVTRQVLTVHDLAVIDHPEFFNRRYAAWYRFLLPRLVHRVRRIIAVSQFTKQRLIEVFGVPEKRITVIWNGIDERFCPRPEEQISAAIEKLCIPSHRYLVALGSLEPRKNLKRLLQAWSTIVSGLPNDVWLVLAGAQGKTIVFDGLPLHPLPQRVHLTGHVSDELLPALYAGAIAAPYVSLYEGFGLPALEAMACGTPVLTSNCTALPEVVGDAALMVDPYDLETISEELNRIIKNYTVREGLRQRGIERANQFRWKRTAERTWDLLEQEAR